MDKIIKLSNQIKNSIKWDFDLCDEYQEMMKDISSYAEKIIDISEELKKEKIKLENALLSNAVKVEIKHDPSVELIAAQELIKSLMEQIHRMNCLSHETSKTECEYERRMREREYMLKMEKGLK